jgi:uncharacterized membrane protein required for colicin V production
MDISAFNVTWFDAVVVIMVGAGLFVGKKRGMSNELLDVFCWLLIVVVSPLYYKPLAELLSKLASLSLFHSSVICYLAIAIFIKIIFSYIKRAVGEKLVGSDLFGRGEFYLGALAGALRFFCMVIMFVSIINAKFVTKVMVDAQNKAQEAEFGSSFFPTYGKIQGAVLFESTCGKFFREKLEAQLIEPVNPAYSAAPQKSSVTKMGDKPPWETGGDKTK